MGVSAAQVVKNLLGLLGNLSAMGVVLTPTFTTLRAIIAADNVGGRTCFPFVFTWMNAAALVVYAWPKHDWWVIVVNTVAVVVEGVYCYLYIVYAHGWNRVIAYVMAAVQLVFVVALLVIQFTFFRDAHNPEVREVVFGWIVAGTAILMYLSPFKETAVAAWTRNVESLTPLLSLVCWKS